MSAFFKLILDGVEREVEITRTGRGVHWSTCELVVLGYDLAWDDMLGAMSGQKSEVQGLLDGWQENPTDVIHNHLRLDDFTLRRLACDWAERVLPIFEHEHPEDKRPREAIETARGFAAGNIDAGQLERTRSAAQEAAWAAAEAEAAAYSAARSAAQAAAQAAAWSAAAQAASWARSAAWAAAQAWAAAPSWAAAEKVWQVCHFVHAMECVQAGKDWPSITETP